MIQKHQIKMKIFECFGEKITDLLAKYNMINQNSLNSYYFITSSKFILKIIMIYWIFSHLTRRNPVSAFLIEQCRC